MSQAPNLKKLYEVVEATWPPLERQTSAPWIIRNGAGGGKRVSSATAQTDVTADEITKMEAAQRTLGQTPLVMVQSGQDALDQTLADFGYRIVDPVNIYQIKAANLADQKPPAVSMFTIWEPLQVQRDIWVRGGIGAARQAVMARAQGPKTSILARWNDNPAGTGFVAISENIAMIHAIEIAPEYRKQGVGTWMMRAAARWAVAQGANWLSVICTQENKGANALYQSLKMDLVGSYHYRIKE